MRAEQVLLVERVVQVLLVEQVEQVEQVERGSAGGAGRTLRLAFSFLPWTGWIGQLVEETEFVERGVARLPDDDVVHHWDVQQLGCFLKLPCEPDVILTRRWCGFPKLCR